MALQAMKQGSRSPPSAADTDAPRRPLAPGGMGCSKRAAVDGLPDDALVEILSRLPAKSLCRSKCVSKAWCDLIADRLRCRKLPLTLEGFFYGCVYESRNEDRVFSCCGVEGCSGEGNNEDGSEDNNEGGSEDDKECGSENNEGASEDKHEGGECKGEKPSCNDSGSFINLLGRSVPLVDPLFSVLRKQPGIKNFTLLDSCNGLLLFGQSQCSVFGDTSSYIVYNPATEHWVHVPSSGFSSNSMEFDDDSDDDVGGSCVLTYLIFDPVISSHFQLIELCHSLEVGMVQTYSSKDERWGDRPRERRRWKKGGEWDLHRTMTSMRGSTFFNMMLHLIISTSSGPELIVAIDGKGKTHKVIRWVENHGVPVFVGQSKGLLHCVTVSGHPDGNSGHMTELSVWVLEDYNAEEWKLKHTVSFSELFGKRSCQFASDYNVVTIHPDQNLVFFIQHWDYKLISYDMDHKEVGSLCTVGCYYSVISPYVPYFSETPALSKKEAMK